MDDLIKKVFPSARKIEQLSDRGYHPSYVILVGRDQKIKLNIFDSVERVHEVESILLLLEREKLPFPKFLKRIDRFLFTEFVEGVTMNKYNRPTLKIIKEVASVQAKLNKLGCVNNVSQFFTELKGDIKRVISSLSRTNVLRQHELRECRSYLSLNWPKQANTGTIHKDIDPRNIIIADDKLKAIIDCEFLRVYITEIDLIIAIHALCRNDKQKHTYLNEYAEIVDIHAFVENEKFWDLYFHLTSTERAASHQWWHLLGNRVRALRKCIAL